MSTSGTYAYAPSVGDVVLAAYSLIGVRRFELTTQHLIDASDQINLQMVEFSNRNPNQWARETIPVPLSANTPTYVLPNRVIAVVLATVAQTQGGGVIETVIGPLSGNDYAALPNKTQVGRPSSFWFNLLTIPEVSVWPIPPQTGIFTLNLQVFRQMQDALLPGGLNVDTPYRFLDALVQGLAYRLAGIYPPTNPNRRAEIKADYDAAFTLAAQRDQETTALSIRPQLSGYFR